jgi:hypothetical protein
VELSHHQNNRAQAAGGHHQIHLNWLPLSGRTLSSNIGSLLVALMCTAVWIVSGFLRTGVFNVLVLEPWKFAGNPMGYDVGQQQ